MLEQGSSVDLPVFKEISEAEDSFPIRRVLTNGIDINLRKASIHQRCEEEYFHRLLEENPGLIGIGPHLIDGTLGESRYSGDVRPDSMLFKPRYRIGEVIFPDQAVIAQQAERREIELVLITLAEFKIKSMNGFHRKIKGFSSLLERLREDPDIFKRLINGINPSLDFPSIVVPPDGQIKVRFISTDEHEVPENSSLFKIEHERMALPQKYLDLLEQALQAQKIAIG